MSHRVTQKLSGCVLPMKSIKDYKLKLLAFMLKSLSVIKKKLIISKNVKLETKINYAKSYTVESH